LQILTPRIWATRIEQEVADNFELFCTLTGFNVGLAVGKHVSLNRNVRCTFNEDAVVMVATASALGFGVNVAIDDPQILPTANANPIAAAWPDLRRFNRDVGGFFDVNAISRKRADGEILIHAAMLIADDQRRAG
jgi:hypothetical protein